LREYRYYLLTERVNQIIGKCRKKYELQCLLSSNQYKRVNPLKIVSQLEQKYSLEVELYLNLLL